VWDDNFDPAGNAVDVLVSRVRRKVDGGPVSRAAPHGSWCYVCAHRPGRSTRHV